MDWKLIKKIMGDLGYNVTVKKYPRRLSRRRYQCQITNSRGVVQVSRSARAAGVCLNRAYKAWQEECLPETLVNL